MTSDGPRHVVGGFTLSLSFGRGHLHIESFLAALCLSLAAQSRGCMLLKRSRSDLNDGHRRQTSLLAAIDLVHAAHLQAFQVPNLRGARPSVCSQVVRQASDAGRRPMQTLFAYERG